MSVRELVELESWFFAGIERIDADERLAVHEIKKAEPQDTPQRDQIIGRIKHQYEERRKHTRSLYYRDLEDFKLVHMKEWRKNR